MKNTGIKIGVCALIGLFAVGCATRKEVVRFKEDTSYLRQQVEALRQENKEIRRMLQELNKSMLALQDETRQTKADLLSEMENLKAQSQVLDSKLEDTSYRMSSFLQKAGGEYSRHPPQDSLVESFTSQSGSRKGLDPKELYNAAYLDLSRGNYQLAIQGFQEYLTKFPDSDLADNAQYWIGEAYYAQKDYQKAIEEFNKVIMNFPKGDKLAAALLKIGYSYVNLGDSASGKKYFKMVVERFPNSEEARLARGRLASNN